MKIKNLNHQFTVETIKTLRVERYATTENHLRVVVLINDGERTKLHLEKRRFRYMKAAEGEDILKPQRQKMLNADDIKFIVENSEDIINLMEGRIQADGVKLVGETGL